MPVPYGRVFLVSHGQLYTLLVASTAIMLVSSIAAMSIDQLNKPTREFCSVYWVIAHTVHSAWCQENYVNWCNFHLSLIASHISLTPCSFQSLTPAVIGAKILIFMLQTFLSYCEYHTWSDCLNFRWEGCLSCSGGKSSQSEQKLCLG